ncbi:hypothetical protein RHGRI_031133 [Rhododendron griersonianum]|uniref:Uncharacterized protein n=1 Tax=Rhododendron griersonianum TaxID=479676 RepID=A0AAV6I6N8_9ERIC|nr:hypothetical protein RHGRI_031133 [Rhododendron griersonianum]
MESRSIADETFLVRKPHTPAFDLDVDWSDGRRWKEAGNGQGEGKRGRDEDGTVDDEERGEDKTEEYRI